MGCQVITAEELRDLFIIANAARAWWDRLRPRGWTVEEHIELPAVNATTSAEIELAHAVARKIKDDAKRAGGVK
jgi:hypothetical protein